MTMYDYLNKDLNLTQLNNYIYSKTLSMFDYSGLPDSLPAIEIEKILQRKGFGFVSKVGDDLYIFDSTFSGEKDAYGNSLKVRVDNVWLKHHKELDIKEDGVLIKNDDMSNGLEPLINRVNSLMIENEITMYVDNFNSRIQTLLSAGDDSTKESADKFLENVKAGKIGAIGETQIFDGLKTHNANSTSQNSTIHLIELNQYLKASLYNELGLSSNFNMKRERLNTKEVEMNNDVLYPFVDNMLKNRQEGIDKINEMFGTEISVEFGSIWKKKKDDEEVETEVEEKVEPEKVNNVSTGLTIEQLVLNVVPNDIQIAETVEEVEEDEQLSEMDGKKEEEEDDNIQSVEEE